MSKGTKQIRIGKIERQVEDWEKELELMKELNVAYNNLVVEGKIETLERVINELKEVIGLDIK